MGSPFLDPESLDPEMLGSILGQGALGSDSLGTESLDPDSLGGTLSPPHMSGNAFSNALLQLRNNGTADSMERPKRGGGLNAKPGATNKESGSEKPWHMKVKNT